MIMVYRIGRCDNSYETDQYWIASRSIPEALELYYRLEYKDLEQYDGDLHSEECNHRLAGFHLEFGDMAWPIAVPGPQGTVQVKTVRRVLEDALSSGVVPPFLVKHEEPQRMFLVGHDTVAAHVIIAKGEYQALNYFYDLIGEEELAEIREYCAGASEPDILQCFVQEIPKDSDFYTDVDGTKWSITAGEVVWRSLLNGDRYPKLFTVLAEIGPDLNTRFPRLNCGHMSTNDIFHGMDYVLN